MDNELPVYSRGQEYHPLGKCTSEIKAMVPSALKEKLEERASALGMTPSELLRNIVTANLFGVEVFQRVHAERIAAYAGNPAANSAPRVFSLIESNK
jgi:hypothetical protein